MIYIPNYIRQRMDYKKGEKVAAEDYNAILNLLVTASDYNSETLNAIFNDEDTTLVINSINAERADEADVAHNSEQLSNATLSRSTNATLENNDNKIPSSKQVKDYVDGLQTSNNNIFSTISTHLNNIDAKNTVQDNRLANIDLINNQYGTRISLLENRMNTNESAITSVREVNLAQDATLAQHNQRITNLELGEVPSDILSTLMTKGSYVVTTGNDPEGNPIYSPDIVKKAQVALNLLVDGAEIPANTFAYKSAVETLTNNSFLTRGSLPNPNAGAYTVGELKQLKHGSYEVTAEQSTALNTGGIAGTLRLYPCGNGLSLEYEIQAGEEIGRLYTMFVPASVLDNTVINTLTWYDERGRFNAVETRVINLENSRLVAANINSGTDINVVKNGNNITFNYTGPKIVISSTQPASDPNRQTLWIQI